jgi:hypothetical protein
MKKTSLLQLVLSAVVLLSAGTAMAGARWAYPISISKNGDGSGSAQGSLADVRNSADQSYIGCDVTVAPTSSPYIYCSAYDSTNYRWLGCSSNQAAFVSLASSISTSTMLWFNVDAQGSCTSIRVSNWSPLSIMAP